jgi:hypothetical protein
MGMPDLDFWAKEWPVIRDAPHLVLGGIIIIIAITGSIIWLIINWGYRQRLKLAYEREAFADKVRDDIARQFNDFKGAAAAGVGIDALIARVAKLEASHNELTTADKAVSSAIGLTGIFSRETFGTPSIRTDSARINDDTP